MGQQSWEQVKANTAKYQGLAGPQLQPKRRGTEEGLESLQQISSSLPARSVAKILCKCGYFKKPLLGLGRCLDIDTSELVLRQVFGGGFTLSLPLNSYCG